MRILCKVTDNNDVQHIIAELCDAYIHQDSNYVRCTTTADDDLVITGTTADEAQQILQTLLSVGYVDASQWTTYLNDEPPEEEESEEDTEDEEEPQTETTRKRGFFNRDPWDRH